MLACRRGIIHNATSWSPVAVNNFLALLRCGFEYSSASAWEGQNKRPPDMGGLCRVERNRQAVASPLGATLAWALALVTVFLRFR